MPRQNALPPTRLISRRQHAGRPCRRRLQSGQLLAAWQRRRCCRRCWSANIATTRRCFGNRKSSHVMASIFRDDRRSPDGSAAPAGGSKLSANSLPRMYFPQTAGPNAWFRAAQWRRATTLRRWKSHRLSPNQREFVSTFLNRSLDPRKKNTV